MSGRRVTVGAPGNVAPPFDSVVKAVQRNEQQGFGAVWWSDHLMSWWPQSIWLPELVPPAKLQADPHINFDPLPLMAAVGCQTTQIKVGMSVTDAARRPPAVLAQLYLTLDHITKGRAIFGMGAGEACNLAPYGIAGNKPISRLEESLRIIRLLWQSDQPVDYDGEFWKLRGAIISLPPYRPGNFPPIWVGGTAERTLRIVGELADGWIPVTMDSEIYRRRSQAISAAALKAGRDPEDITRAIWAFIVVDEDHEVCHRLLNAVLIRDLCLALPDESFRKYGCTHPLGEGALGLQDYIPSLVPKERALELIQGVPFEVVHEYIVHGTPDEIADYFKPFIAQGVTHIALHNVTFAGDERKVASSFRLMAQIPKLIEASAP